MQKISLSPTYKAGNEISYIIKAIDNGEISNYGENLDIFERQLESFFSKKGKIALLNSATSAIHLALIHLGVTLGDEIICQSFTFAASAYPILYRSAKPVFIDSEEETWNMCPFSLEAAIKDRISKGKTPKAIILTHTYGMPAKLDELLAISIKYNIPVIEDAAGALGSKYKGQKCGSFGDFGVISFNGNKIITSSGGGALICKINTFKEKTIFLSTQAKDDAPHYQHSEVGYNYKMSNIIAGIGRGQMEVLEERILLRREINEFYKDTFKNVEGIGVFKEPNLDYYSNHWLSCIFVDSEITGFNIKDLRLELLSKNIESKPLWKPMHMQPVFNKFPFYGNGVSKNLFNNGLCLPSGSNLTEKNKQFITKTILGYINHYK